MKEWEKKLISIIFMLLSGMFCMHEASISYLPELLILQQVQTISERPTIRWVNNSANATTFSFSADAVCNASDTYAISPSLITGNSSQKISFSAGTYYICFYSSSTWSKSTSTETFTNMRDYTVSDNGSTYSVNFVQR